MTATPPGPPPDAGKASGWLTAVKGLTITNALVIVLLVIALGPAYFLYRLLNDEKLMDRFMSNYQEFATQMSSCTERRAQVRGGASIWGISTGFAYEGDDRWAVSVALDHEPDAEEIESYCRTLNLIVDYMRNPNHGPSPKFPDSDKQMIWKYPKQQEN